MEISIDPAQLADMAAELRMTAETYGDVVTGIAQACCCTLPPNWVGYVSGEDAACRGILTGLADDQSALAADLQARAEAAANGDLSSATAAAYGAAPVVGVAAAGADPGPSIIASTPDVTIVAPAPSSGPLVLNQDGTPYTGPATTMSGPGGAGASISNGDVTIVVPSAAPAGPVVLNQDGTPYTGPSILAPSGYVDPGINYMSGVTITVPPLHTTGPTVINSDGTPYTGPGLITSPIGEGSEESAGDRYNFSGLNNYLDKLTKSLVPGPGGIPNTGGGSTSTALNPHFTPAGLYAGWGRVNGNVWSNAPISGTTATSTG